MGNCSGKQSKQDKQLAKEVVYKPSKKDTRNKKGKPGNWVGHGQNGLQSSKGTTAKAKDLHFEEIKDKEMKKYNESKILSEKLSAAVLQIEQLKSTDNKTLPSAMDVNGSNTLNNFTNKKGPDAENSENDADSTKLKTNKVVQQPVSMTELQKAVQEVTYVDSMPSTNNKASANTAETRNPGENKFEGKPYLFAKGTPNEPPEQEEKDFIDKKAPETDRQPKVLTGNHSNVKCEGASKCEQTEDATLSSQPNYGVTRHAWELTRKSHDPKDPTETLNPNNKMSVHTSYLKERNEQRGTGYDDSKFASPERKQDQERVKEHSDSGNSKRSKDGKKKMRKDKWGPPPDFRGSYTEKVDFLFIGCDNIKNIKIEKPAENVEESKPRFVEDVATMKILMEVSQSVGFLKGSKQSGTCWRAGEDKIITAAHVVKSNIYDDFNEYLNERELNKCCVNFNYVDSNETESTIFYFEPKILYFNENLDVAVLQLKKEEGKEFPKALQMFHILDPKKDVDKEIRLISHNKGKAKQMNGNIGLWTPNEKKLRRLQKLCEEHGEKNGYTELDRKDRLVIKCDFTNGASGSPGIILLNSTAHVVMIYVRGFPDFYYSNSFPESKKTKFPKEMLFQQGVCIGSLYKSLANDLQLRNEIFPHQAKGESIKHQYAMAGENSRDVSKQIICSAGYDNTVVINPSDISNQTCDPARDPTVENQNKTMYKRQSSHVLPSGKRQDIQCFIAVGESGDTNMSSNQNIHGEAITGTDETQVQDDKDFGLTRNPGKTKPISDINPDLYTLS